MPNRSVRRVLIISDRGPPIGRSHYNHPCRVALDKFDPLPKGRETPYVIALRSDSDEGWIWAEGEFSLQAASSLPLSSHRRCAPTLFLASLQEKQSNRNHVELRNQQNQPKAH